MNFAESVSYLYSLGNEVLAMKLGLETVQALASALRHPQRKFPAIHIAGTNGKGSTAAMTEAILRVAGLRVGLYTSPNLISITERYRVDGDDIAEDDFARLATIVRQAGETLVAKGLLEAPPTFFEQVTMIGYLHFAERQVDLAVLEVGMGGRLDATNICQPLVTAITPIGFDHQQYLGNTLAAIAGEKAGIIKPNVPVIVAPQADEAMQVIAVRATELNALLIPVADESFSIEPSESGKYRLRYRDYDALLNLRGRHQAENAMTAILIAKQLRQLGWKIERQAIQTGLSNAVWPGRLQLIESPKLPPMLVDGAHNPAGAETLRSFLTEHYAAVPLTLIFGAMADKAAIEMAEILFPITQHFILTKADNPRAASPQSIAEQTKKLRPDAVCTHGLAEALVEAERITPANGLIVICGSLYLAGELLHHLTTNVD
ncbi:MAG: folylpolyglutamate synthase/dihydrofolate synthase family protein [Acidobacteriota bacterium]|nr:folylpolyglutamate synthase/dihydrofolate synthase family protein [Acidobacteriota bacterium]